MLPCDRRILIEKAGKRFKVRCRICPNCRTYFARVRFAKTKVELSKIELHWYGCVLSFRFGSLPEEEAKQVCSLFLRKLRDAIRPEKIRYESVLERGEENGNLHFHTFIGSTNHALTKRRIKKLWVKLAGFLEFLVITDALINYTQKTLRNPLHPERVNVRGNHVHSTKWGQESSPRRKIKKAALQHNPDLKLRH